MILMALERLWDIYLVILYHFLVKNRHARKSDQTDFFARFEKKTDFFAWFPRLT
jgi:hypothetical protein